MTPEEYESKVELAKMYVGNVLSDMKNVSKSTTKGDMLAYISAWENELQTVTYLIE